MAAQRLAPLVVVALCLEQSGFAMGAQVRSSPVVVVADVSCGPSCHALHAAWYLGARGIQLLNVIPNIAVLPVCRCVIHLSGKVFVIGCRSLGLPVVHHHVHVVAGLKGAARALRAGIATLGKVSAALCNVSCNAERFYCCKIRSWETASTKAQGLISTYIFSQKGFLTEDTNALRISVERSQSIMRLYQHRSTLD